MVVEKILKYLTDNKSENDSLRYEAEKLAGWAFKRQFQTDSETNRAMGLSGCGNCPRKLAYKLHGFEVNGKEIDSRANVTFFMGDILEAMVMCLAKASGLAITATGMNQITVSLKIGDKIVYGHPDGLLFYEREGILVECKSMSDFSYQKFEKGEIDYSYECQINSYLESLGFNRCVIIAVNKNNGMIAEKIIVKSPEIVKFLKENLKAVLESTKESLPKPMFEPNDKGELPWQCRYCAYFKTCWPNSELVLKGKSYVLKVKEAK